MSRAEACLLLGLESMTPTAQEVKDAWRQTAMRTHPDHGGAVEVFRASHTAYKWLLKEVESEEAICRPCQGRGLIVTHKGFLTCTTRCEACGGTGQAPRA